MRLLHTLPQPYITHIPFFWCLLDPPETCCHGFVGLIKLCHLFTGLFWDAVDSFAGLFDGFYYIFTGESTSKADKFDNFCSMQMLNMPLTQKSLEAALRDLYWDKTPEQMGVNLEVVGGWISMQIWFLEVMVIFFPRPPSDMIKFKWL